MACPAKIRAVEADSYIADPASDGTRSAGTLVTSCIDVNFPEISAVKSGNDRTVYLSLGEYGHTGLAEEVRAELANWLLGISPASYMNKKIMRPDVHSEKTEWPRHTQYRATRAES